MTNGKKILLIVTAAAVVLCAVVYEAFFKNKFTTANSNISLKYAAGSKAEFYSYNKNLFYLTKDALQYINNAGDVVWSDTFNMAEPYMINDSGIAAVMEKDGRLLKVYTEKGLSASITTDNPIASASLNSSGGVCIISNGDSYNLGVYNKDGEKIFDGNFASADGLPVCSDISDDGKILAVSFLDTSEINVKSKVCFYYIGENSSDISQNSDSDDMFASYIEDDAVVGRLSFMQDNSLAALSDKSLKLVSLNPTGSEKYSERFSIEINNKITAADFSDKKNICLAFGEALLNAENAETPNTVKWFSCKGSETGKYEAPKDIDALSSGYDATIISMGRQFAAADYKGSIIWEYTATQDVKKMIFAASREDVLLVGTEEAYSININEKAKIENEEAEEQEQENGENEGNGDDTGADLQTPEEETDPQQSLEQPDTQVNANDEQDNDNKAEAGGGTPNNGSASQGRENSSQGAENNTENNTEKNTEKNDDKKEETGSDDENAASDEESGSNENQTRENKTEEEIPEENNDDMQAGGEENGPVMPE